MGRITSSIGLATGFPIQETVDQLIAISGRRRDLLVNQNKKIDAQRTAVTVLTAQLIAIQIQVRRLGLPTIFSQREVTSSDDTLLAATSTGTPQLGSYRFTPLRAAQAQQLQSTRLASATQPRGKGAFSFRFGGFVDSGVGLDLLGGGAGFSAGKIRVTDRSGASAEIDLSLARNIDDVLDAINASTAIGVRATVYNDGIRLIDETGQTLSNLRVEEVGGTTAASLGLAGINVTASQADGLDLIGLFGDLGLSHLNDGNGVRFDGFLGDLRITLRDGSRLDIDFNKLAHGGVFAQATVAAAQGENSSLTFTAKKAGPEYGGVNISFVDDDSIVAGQEVVEYDAAAKTLVFHIDEGETTANHIIAALGRDPEASEDFAATRPGGSTGTGRISATDGAVTTGPRPTARTPGGANAALVFQARNAGGQFDNVEIRFIDDPAVTRGNEIAAFDDTNPLDRALVFHIDAGATTANDIIAALGRDAYANQLFSAENVEESTGEGLVKVSDTAQTSGGTLVAQSETVEDVSIQQVLDVINAAAPDKLQATIGANNNLVLTDLSSDSGYAFQVEQLNGSHAAEDLGLNRDVVGGTLNGRRLLAGLKTSLLASLNGGAGLGDLGFLGLSDRSGALTAVDLSFAETIDDVLEAINTSGLGIAARVNDARNGIVLSDTSGGAGNLVVGNGDATNTADKLQITVDAAQASVSSGSLRRRVLSEATLLSSLNGGSGVALGSFRITDNAGNAKTLTIDSSVKTIGDVLTAIDRLDLALEARINDAGDGILLIDNTAGGTLFKVTEGSGTTARDLSLLAKAKTITLNGVQNQVIDGSSTYRIEIGETDTLEDVVGRISELTTRVRASIFNDGSTVKPYRLTLTSQSPGSGGELLWDTSEAGFSFEESVNGQDALLQIGASGGGGVIASSSTGVFKELLADVSLTVKGESLQPVTVSIAPTQENMITAVKDFVDAYNKVRDKLNELTRFDETTQTAAILQGDSRILRVQIELDSLASGQITGAGSIRSLGVVGISLKEDGQLQFDENKLKQRFEQSPDEVEEFFSLKEFGLSARFDKLVERLAGVGDTVLVGRVGTLTRKIEQNQQRIDLWNARLEKQRERLLKSFERSESIIAKLQSSLSALNSIAPLPILQPAQ